MSEDKRRIITLLKRLYAAIKSTNKNVSSIKEDNMVLLWENSSPGSAFAAQTISLDLTDYKWVKIESLPTVSTNGKNVTTNEFKCPGAGNTFAPTVRTDVGSSGWWHGSRTVEITNTGITFGQGGFRYSNTTTQTANDSYGIPLRIWGVKKSYSVSLVKDVLPAENGGTGVTSLEELKSKLGVISGGGGSGGGGGPLTLSDSRLLQTYLSLRNKELWSGAEWNSGTKTIPGISNYNTLLCKIDLGNSSCVLNRRTATTFQGSCNVPYDSWVATAAIELTISGDSTTISQWEWLANTASSNHGVINKTYGVKEIIGVEPTEAYVKNQLELDDTEVSEDGTIKFKPVDVENRTLLWTNPSPRTQFAPQTVLLEHMNDYDSVVIQHNHSDVSTRAGISFLDLATDTATIMTQTDSSADAKTYLISRIVKVVNGGLAFEGGYYKISNSTSAGTNLNKYCVPNRIYGIKNKVTVDIPKVELSNLGGATIDPDKVITLKDYIVDEGTSGIWTYRKWNSGIAECWGQKSQLVSSNNVQNIDAFDFPFTFAEVPEVNVGCTANGADLYRVHNLSNYTTTSSMRLTFINKYTSGSVTVTASIYVKGYWKALESSTTEVAAVKENTARLSIDMDGYEKSELVWTNPNPTTNFDPQTLTFNGVYDKLEIIFNYDTTYPDRVGTQKVIVNDSDETILNATWAGNATRRVIAKSANGKTTLEVQKGIRYISSAGDSNAVCIPYKIYGIQTTSKLEGTVTGDNITLDIGVNKAADLNPDTLIPSGADLDDYLEFGSYLSPRKAISASLVNCPHATSGFSLQVIKTSSGGKMQLLMSNATKSLVYMRHWDVTFSDWVQMGTTVIKKVWENASPDSDFAGQTINLDLSDYSHLWIEYSGLPVCIVQKNVSTDCWSSTIPSLRYRNVIFTDTAVTFKDGGYITAYGGTQKSSNSVLRPKIIRGIKGVL